MKFITNSDIELCKKRSKLQLIRIFLLDKKLITIDEIEGECISGNISIDADSEIRRTLNLVLYSKDKKYVVNEYNRIWFNKRVQIQIGFKTHEGHERWYDMGIYIFNNCAYTYASDTKTISIQCSDLITSLDGTHGGVLDGPAFLIKEGEDIKKVIEDLLVYHTDIRDYNIGTIGEYGCIQGKSISWKQNRMDTGSSQSVVDLEEADATDYLSDSPYLDDYVIVTASSNSELYSNESDEEIVSGVDPADYIDMGSWHTVPYDIEFSCGTPLIEMIIKLRDLYLGYESYFDVEGQFILDLIPTCEHDPLFLDYFDLEPLVIDESLTVDFTTIKNATRIYGKSIETDRFADNDCVKLSECEVDGVKGYMAEINLDKFILTSNLKLGFQLPNVNKNFDTNLPLFIKVNHYESVILPTGELSEKETPFIIPCTTRENIINTNKDNVESETVYKPMALSFFESEESYCFKYISNQNTFMYLGMYQIEAYVEDNNEESPFSVNKIGTRLQVLSGGEYDDITDVILCKERAEYENWLAGRFNDVVTINTVIIPFLDVNKKVRYRTFSNGEINQYIIKNISYSFLDNTCNITMSRFYDLYPFIICSSSVEDWRNKTNINEDFYIINSFEEPTQLNPESIWEKIINNVLLSTDRMKEFIASVDEPENMIEGNTWEKIL